MKPMTIGLEKMPTGIAGFDTMAGGGIPRHRTTLVAGGPGCGKTVFGLQTLVNGARQGEPGIFVSFEEHPQQIRENAATFDWDLQALEDQQRLFLLDAHMIPDMVTAGSFDLGGLLAVLEAKASAMGARRIVFDALDVLLTILNNPVLEHQELYRIRSWLADHQLTGILTIRLDDQSELVPLRFSSAQFMADCEIMLQHRLIAQISSRGLRIVKYRGSGFIANEIPFGIDRTGIHIPMTAIHELAYPVFTERVSTGVERLDTMLEGGYYRGTSMLITGAPGAAKSTLASAFLQAACRRGEKALYISFDEGAGEIIRNMAAVGITLGPFVEAGLLQIASVRTNTKSGIEHLIALTALIEEHQPDCLVIDPLSAIERSNPEQSVYTIAQHLLHLTKSRGITCVCTSLIDANDPQVEQTSLQVSTIADTWIQLSYRVQSGERNRTLTIIKSRGTGHSNQVRELIVSDAGVTLADVYMAGGAVLMGTLRWEQENAERKARDQSRAETKRKRLELQAMEAEILAQIETLKRKLELHQAERERMAREQYEDEQHWTNNDNELARLRRSDYAH